MPCLDALVMQFNLPNEDEMLERCQKETELVLQLEKQGLVRRILAQAPSHLRARP